MLELAVNLKWFILLVGAIATGLFVRTMGQWAIDWAKEPNERKKRQDDQRAALEDIKSCLAKAHRHIDQLDHYLSGRAGKDEGEEEGTVIIPTFNLDLEILEHHAPNMRKIVSEESLGHINMVRFELLHLRRRIDTLSGLMSLIDDASDWRVAAHVHGTRKLIDSTFKIVSESIELLNKDLASIPKEHAPNRRPLGVVAVFLACASFLAWVATWDAPTAVEDNPRHPDVIERGDLDSGK